MIGQAVHIFCSPQLHELRVFIFNDQIYPITMSKELIETGADPSLNDGKEGLKKSQDLAERGEDTIDLARIEKVYR